MQRILLLYAILGVITALDCDFCLHGYCLTPASFNNSAPNAIKAEKIAIDYNDNILYFTDDDHLKAIDLDDKTTRDVWSFGAAFVTVDEKTGDVYYDPGYPHIVYKYMPKSSKNNKTEKVYINDAEIYNLWVHDAIIYFNTKWRGLEFMVSNKTREIKVLQDVHVYDIAFDKTGNMFVSTGDKVYKVKDNIFKNIITAKSKATNYTISANKDGEIYIYDANTHLIYLIDSASSNANPVGYFKNHTDQYIYFDKHNDVISHKLYYSCSYFEVTSEECEMPFRNS